ncbi:hypothetical protein T069G_08627 [Trichoderma breve]|uniref:Uncharacterized protein n=1 Tax=Trichoderma breve TaxID=2034170 RepID=A0A9W9BCC9_9HYPO|nr:hypothetical protein T069G_08627 [Trichoderma breve]KAJ4857730.1 hypothetical protein T069G_08627 [Trichoderma breve]
MASDTLDAVDAGASVAASGDEGTATEEAAAPNEARSHLKRMAAISVWNSVLLHVNETLLPGFARHHIGRLARSVASGLRVEVQTAWGSRIPSTIILRLQIRNGDDIIDFAVINLPMGQTKLPLTTDYLHATDESLMKDTFPDPRMDHFGAAHSRFRNQDLGYFKTIEPTAEISSFIKHTSTTIVRVTAAVEAHEFTIMYPSHFWDHIHRLPASLQRVAKNIKSLFDSMNPEEQVSLQVTFPFSPNWEKDWHVFFTDERKVNAEILDIASLCNGSEWTPKTNDEEEYGMFGTHLPTAYLMAVSLKNVRDFLPDTGAKVNVYLRDIAQNGYTLPKPQTSKGETYLIADSITCSLLNTDWKADQQIGHKFGFDHPDRAELVTELFPSMAAVELEPYLPMPDKDDPEHQEARKVAASLRLRDDEDHIACFWRVHSWLRPLLCVAPKTRYHEPYSGHRLALPPGISADVALFYVEVPRQRDWPRDLKKPPMSVDIPDMSPPTDLQLFLANAFENQDEVVRAEIRHSFDAELYDEEGLTLSLKGTLGFNHVADDWLKSMVKASDLPKTDRADLSQGQSDNGMTVEDQTETTMYEGEASNLTVSFAKSLSSRLAAQDSVTRTTQLKQMAEVEANSREGVCD